MSKISVENPLGVLAIDHLEYTADSLSTKTKDLFYTMGFAKVAEQVENNNELFSQGQVRFLLTSSKNPESHSRKYFNLHGEGVSKISFLVEDVEHAYNEAINRGAQSLETVEVYETAEGLIKTAVIKGFGDVANEFVQRPASVFRVGYSKVENDPKAKPLAQRCARIDHLTNNVPKGEMKKWVQFYEDIYGFKVTRYFDIKGVKTGLLSEVVQSHDGSIIIPINEPESENGKSQIQEFLDLHKGPGVQHVALTTANIISTVGDLQERGIEFLDIPHTYYEDIPKRDFVVEENIDELEKRSLLVDGDKDGYLLQIFTNTYIGPLFFEYIQRKNHNGFGEGNFQALFDSIERDQIQRGYLKE